MLDRSTPNRPDIAGRKPMHICRRCGGLMILELFDDVKEFDIPSELPGTRCINCGNIEDAVIHANRTRAPSSRQTGNDIARRRRKSLIAIH
jgi:hypothetical protein